ncbi:unnamed protein product [Amaranthus hypochondriacus]
MGSRTLVVLCILSLIFVVAYTEAARDVLSGHHAAHKKANGIEDAKYDRYQGGGYPGRGGPGGGYPGRGGGGGYPGRHDSCRFGCCGRKDYYGNCLRCCPPA